MAAKEVKNMWIKEHTNMISNKPQLNRGMLKDIVLQLLEGKGCRDNNGNSFVIKDGKAIYNGQKKRVLSGPNSNKNDLPDKIVFFFRKNKYSITYESSEIAKIKAELEKVKIEPNDDFRKICGKVSDVLNSNDSYFAICYVSDNITETADKICKDAIKSNRKIGSYVLIYSRTVEQK